MAGGRAVPVPWGGLLPLALSETCGFSLALLSEQGCFHRIEGFKETFLPCRRLFAGEAHCEEGEAVAGEPVGGIRLPILGMEVGGMLKIQQTEFF